MADSQQNLRTRVVIDSDTGGLKRITLDTAGAVKSVEQLDQAVKQAGDQLREATQDFDRLAKEANSLEAAVTQANQELKETGQAGRQAGSDLKILEDQIQDAAHEWKLLNSTVIAAKTEYKRMKDSAATTTEQLEEQSQKISDVSRAELEAIAYTRNLIQQYTQLGGGVDGTSASFNRLSSRLQEAEGWINGITPKVKAQEKGFNDVARAVDGAADKLNGISGMLARANEALDKKLSEARIGLWTKAFDIMGDAAMNALRAVVDFVNESNQQFQEFDKQIRQVYTLAPGQSAAMKQALSADARAMGQEIGRVSDEYLPAMYQALSLGIPEDNSLAAITTASEAARAANAELTPTLVTGQSIVNAYGGELYDLGRVYDLLFFAVKNGAVTIEELNAGMSEITSVAGETGVSLEDVASAIIVMTKQGDSFEEASGLIANMLTQLSISGTAMGKAFQEAAGTDFRTFIAEGGNLAQALQIIQDHVKATGGTLTETLGGDSNFYRDQQAMRGALELTGKHMDEFLTLTLQAADAQGLVADASAEVAGSMELQASMTAATTEALQIQIGQALEPARRSWLEFKLEMAKTLGVLASALNNDYGAAVTSMIEQNVAAAESQEDLIAYSKQIAASLKESKVLGLWDISGAGDDLQAGLADLALSMVEIQDVGDDLDAQFYAVRDALQAVYGASITTRDGWILLDGTAIGYGTDLYYLAQQHQEAARAAAAQAEQEDLLNRAVSEAGSADAIMLRNAGLWNGVEAATQLAGLLAVLDGDTIRVDLGGEIQDVRFRNVNAPEIQHGDEAAMPWAYEAMDATQAYFDQNPVELGAVLNRETYDRIIAGFPDLEKELTRKGLAIPLPATLTEDPELYEDLVALAQEAAAAGEGMFEDQALAARILNGEMVDLGEYYEELADHQGRVNDAFGDAAGPVRAYYDALAAVAEVPAWNTTGIQEAKDAVLQANEDIIASHQRLAYETYLAQNGVTEGTIAMGVAMGIFSEAEGEKRLAYANTQAAVEELILKQADLKLSDDELIEATQLLIGGMYATPEAAAEAVKGLGNLDGSARTARGSVKGVHDELLAAEGEYRATFVTENITINKTYNKTYNEEYTGPTSKSNPDKPDHKASGGRLAAGVPYLVGDDPNGGLTPYSELFIPDTAGYLMNANSTAALLSGSSRSAAVEATAGGNTYEITIVIEGDRSDLDHVADAAQAGVTRALEALDIARATGRK